ncbi:selenocysteine-specific translation elongation factor [Bacillus carboniphilus]|uniref:Selenocysteine-specific elongation factor n=1 Tax=Bacillus carboniphilus TaxID=86663 RepID=A0ABP3FFV5_9BACI
MKKFYTVGMAGHIDHGKTTLTKALTNVDTDRLKEEKERNISIEPGFAPLINNEELQVSIVDVPGHERFIRQMIAGVAGIDMVVLVVAANEGAMPQTKEHLEILSFLGVKKGIIAITKMDLVEAELLELARDEILLELQGTIFENAPYFYIDSLSNKGIKELKDAIQSEVIDLPTRANTGDFRLPIDQVFHVKGQGTVVRGTIFDGHISEGHSVYILPPGVKGTVRGIQVHHQTVAESMAGQRTALNIGGINKEEIKRGDVVVSHANHFSTHTIDVSIRFVDQLRHPVKQRMPVNCHVGTSEVLGTLVFFDRNEIVQEEDEVLCQIRLNEPIVVKRGDRFILRRPTPAETIAGGWVIDPNGKKYKWGEETIQSLLLKKEGTLEERASSVLLKNRMMTANELCTELHIEEAELEKLLTETDDLLVVKNRVTHAKVMDGLIRDMTLLLEQFHSKYPMRSGINKAELVQELGKTYTTELVEAVLDKGDPDVFTREEQYVKSKSFSPHVPKQWEKRVRGLLDSIRRDEYQVKTKEDYLKEAGIPDSLHIELLHYLVQSNKVVSLSDKIIWTQDTFDRAVQTCKNKHPDELTLSNVKDILGLSRKFLIPFLETMDVRGLTRREGEVRHWVG